MFCLENLFGGLSPACDFVDLVQNGFFTPPVVPLQGSFGHRSALRPLCLGYVSIRQTGSYGNQFPRPTGFSLLLPPISTSSRFPA